MRSATFHHAVSNMPTAPAATPRRASASGSACGSMRQQVGQLASGSPHPGQVADAISRAFVLADPTEPLALARLACDVPEDDGDLALLGWVARLVATSEAANVEDAQLAAVTVPALGAAIVAGTPGVGVPSL